MSDTLAEAGRKVLRMHLARMLANEAGTRSGEDIEDLHRMRVATRRMRAAWRVFEGAYRPRVARRYVRELRGVASALGEVRDLDVLMEGLDAYVASLPETGGEALAPLRTAWRDDRERARRRLISLLDSRSYHDFVEDYLELTETVWRDALEPVDEPFVQVGPQLLGKRFVRCVAEQHVRKPVPVVARKLCSIGAHELLAHECQEVSPDVGPDVVRYELHDGAAMKQAPLDRRALDRDPLRRCKRVDSRREQRLERGRDLDGTPGFGLQGDELLHEERVSLRHLEDSAERLFVHLAGEHGGLLGRQGSEHECSRVRPR